MSMSTFPIQINEVIRLYERVNRLKPPSSENRFQGNNADSLNISAEAKKKLVREQAQSAVLERIKK
jgi:hypothetical protein